MAALAEPSPQASASVKTARALRVRDVVALPLPMAAIPPQRPHSPPPPLSSSSISAHSSAAGSPAAGLREILLVRDAGEQERESSAPSSWRPELGQFDGWESSGEEQRERWGWCHRGCRHRPLYPPLACRDMPVAAAAEVTVDTSTSSASTHSGKRHSLDHQQDVADGHELGVEADFAFCSSASMAVCGPRPSRTMFKDGVAPDAVVLNMAIAGVRWRGWHGRTECGQTAAMLGALSA